MSYEIFVSSSYCNGSCNVYSSQLTFLSWCSSSSASASDTLSGSSASSIRFTVSSTQWSSSCKHNVHFVHHNYVTDLNIFKVSKKLSHIIESYI